MAGGRTTNIMVGSNRSSRSNRSDRPRPVLSSRTNVRDLRKISPDGRNDKLRNPRLRGSQRTRRPTRLTMLLLAIIFCRAVSISAADKLIGIHSSRTMSQSMPWIAQEAGVFKKYDLDFQLVFIASSGMVTAALLGGDAEMTLTGGVGNVRGYVQGATDLVFTGSAKNMMTQNIVVAPSIKRPEDLKGKKIAITRIGGNSQYFTIQALRRYNMEAGRDYSFIQTGGDPESLAALLSGGIDTAVLTPPTDAQAIAQGYRYLIYGPDLKIPYAAASFVTKRSVIAKRPQVIGQFMKAMAEASKIMHTDKEFVYKVLGKYLRVTDRNILDSAYNAEIKAMEPRLVVKTDSLQAILDEVAQTDARAKKVKPQELVDSRYLDEMEKSGFMDQLWVRK
jgi:NitT/TauT family transport system substrate-binding protein